ncbi:iron-containing alcohol dehydrogenase [Dongshaea marina]|uniref:iron-containing alcohol dehydrogenase n=1 Tax=Dongshaea marina TaxID=2047966 RepID=UPI00131EEF3D|nr:iron-containing alcohol dehydrogenase [Dongshaea marina]
MNIIRTPELFVGENAIDNISSILARLSSRKLMLITDDFLSHTPSFEKLCQLIDDAGVKIELFDKVLPEPEIDYVAAVVNKARAMNIDTVIAFGGGSPIDTAKVVAALVTNTREIESYLGSELLEQEALPLIAIPTTAGTGSEVTPIAILSDSKDQLKKGIVSQKIIPHFAILDPTLTVGMPPRVTAYTGMDALTHAVEAFNSVNANSYTDTFAVKAIELLTQNIRLAYQDGHNLKARENMLLGSLMAGIAFANAGVTAVHAFAYPLGGMYHIPHGLANSMMFAPVMAYNMVGNEQRFLELARCFRADATSPQLVVDEIRALCRDLNIPHGLRELDIPEQALDELADGVMKVTRLLANNPRELTPEAAREIYQQVY